MAQQHTVSVILEAKIAGFTGPLGQAAKAADRAASSMEDAGKKSEASAKGMQALATGNAQAWGSMSSTLMVAGAAAGAAVGLVAREYANFDQAMSGVASTGEDARRNLAALTDAAKEMGADTAFSAVEAANGVEELARAGVSAKDILGGGLKGSLDLAAAGQLSVADASGLASIALTQFKLSGQDVPHVADLLAAGAGKAMGGVDDLGMALKQSGLVASQFGLSIEETVGGLSAFASAGLLGSDAGTSLKSMLLALANPAGATAKKMAELGISAYDAQGKFIGLEGLAGVLQDRLGGLSDAQRQQALSQIFGNDAIRAASILYEEGAEGIAEWTAAVDDSGYAARTAAELQNNLVGDLEKLGGSWSTLAITMGEAANGPLRGAVQMLTSMLDTAAKYPEVAQGLLGVTAALAGVAVGAGLLMQGVTFVAEFRGALSTLTEASPGLAKVAGSLGSVGKAAGVAAAAFVALTVIAEVTDKLWGVAPAAEAAAAAIERLSQGGGAGTLDSMFKTKDGRDVAQGVGDLTSALGVLNDVRLGLGNAYISDDFFAGLFGATSNLDRIKTQFLELDTAITALPMGEAATSFGELRGAAGDAGLPLADLVALFPNYADQVQQLAAANGLGELSSDDLGAAMAGLYGPLQAVQQGMEGSTTAAAAQGEAYDAAAAAAEAEAAAQGQAAEAAKNALDAHLALVDAIKAVNDAQRAGANLIMTEEQANADWIASLQEATTQIEKNGTSLDANTAKGRENGQYLRDLAVKGRDLTDAMRDNGDGIDVVNAKMLEQRAAFIATIGLFGVTGAAAEQMADRYGLIPNYVETIITAPGAKVSEAEAKDLNDQLRDIPLELRPQIITIANTRGAEAAQAAIDAIQGKTVTVTVRMRQIGEGSGYDRYRQALNDSAAGRAGGGPIFGRGTATSDEIPIWASNGEFMIRTAAAKQIGYARLAYMNRTGEIPRFAGGGPIGGQPVGALSQATAQTAQQVTFIYNLEGKEAMQQMLTLTRDATRTRYQTEGVH